MNEEKSPRSQRATEPRPTAHTFDQVNWDNAEQETRIGVLQEMVAILLNRLDEAEAAQGAAPRAEGPQCSVCGSASPDHMKRLHEEVISARAERDAIADDEQAAVDELLAAPRAEGLDVERRALIDIMGMAVDHLDDPRLRIIHKVAQRAVDDRWLLPPIR